MAEAGKNMPKKFRAQGILCESLDDGACVKLWSSISETDKEPGDIKVRVLRNSRRIQSRSARQSGRCWLSYPTMPPKLTEDF